jgi:hypothetical protein
MDARTTNQILTAIRTVFTGHACPQNPEGVEVSSSMAEGFGAAPHCFRSR